MKLRLLLFDLNVLSSIEVNYQEASKLMGEPNLQSNSNHSGTISQLFQVKKKIPEKDYEKLCAALDDIELGQINRFNLNPGVKNGIEAVKSMNLKIAVITELGTKAVGAFFEKQGLKDFVSEILPRGLVGENLQDRFKAGLEQMKIEPTETIFFCTRLSDLKAARSVGMRVIVLPSKNERINQLLMEKPDGMIMSLEELPDLLSLETYRISEEEKKSETPEPQMSSQNPS